MKLEDAREQEELYLAHVLAVIKQEIQEREGRIRDARQRAQERDPDDYSADVRMSHAISSNEQAIRARREHPRPYFGRFDFRDEEDEEPLVVYLGEVPLSGGAQELVVDWRLPICSLFYRSRGGPASYQSPSGELSGLLQLKRHLTIENETLTEFSDAFGGTAGPTSADDAMLVSLLGRRSSPQMRKIVHTIQEEQDRIIRATADVLVVQGPAGSGKTVVALHRAAYLLFQMRQNRGKRATAQGMLVFSPNSIFSSYIANVLPDLQEDEIRQTVFEQHIQDEVVDRFLKSGTAMPPRAESKAAYEERAIAGQLTEDPNETHWLASSSMMTALEVFVAGLESEFEDALRSARTQGAQELPEFCSLDNLLHRLSIKRGEVSPVERLNSVIRYLDRERTAAKKSIRSFNTDGQEQLARVAGVSARLKESVRVFSKRSVRELYRHFWQSSSVSESQPTLSARKLREYRLEAVSDIPYEDVLPLLCLDGLYRGFRRFADIMHAIVDEAQEYGPLHFEYLKRCLPDGCRLTIAGDLNQTTNDQIGLADYGRLETIFRNRVTRLELEQSYRSSQEISALASRILGLERPIANVRRTGDKPRVVSANTPRELVGSIAEQIRKLSETYPTVALIGKTVESCTRLRKLLSDAFPEIVQLSQHTAAIPTGIFILPLHLAKGLEFDSVIVADADAATYCEEGDRRLLYIASTRALHALVLCHAGQKSPFLPEASENLCDYADTPERPSVLLYQNEVLTAKRFRVTAEVKRFGAAVSELRMQLTRFPQEATTEYRAIIDEAYAEFVHYNSRVVHGSRADLDLISDDLMADASKKRLTYVRAALPSLQAAEDEWQRLLKVERENQRLAETIP